MNVTDVRFRISQLTYSACLRAIWLLLINVCVLNGGCHTEAYSPECELQGPGLAMDQGMYLVDSTPDTLAGYLDTLCMRITPDGDTMVVFDIR